VYKYILSEEAEKDIEEIFDFGEYKFGFSQAIKYLSDIQDQIEAITTNPGIGKKRNEIKMWLYSIPYVSHVIFYRIMDDHIRIVRILYGGRDLVKFLT